MPEDTFAMAARLVEEQGDPGGKFRDEWRAKARPEQIPPPGRWRIWYLAGGRGGGKTWTGAHTLAEWMLSDPEPGEWGVVAPIYADAWSVCIEGESGLLAALGTTAEEVKRGKSRHVEYWHRSFAELKLRSGHVVRVASAEDGGLRIQGKNLKGAWCIAKGELISTLRGRVPVEDVQPGDLVATRQGWKRVTAATRTKRDAPLICIYAARGWSLRCTADHPVWTATRGWVTAGSLNIGDTLLTCRDLFPAPRRGTTGTVRAGTAITPATTLTSKATGADCTSPSGKRRTASRSLTGSSSTTLTTTSPTTTRATSWLPPGPTTTGTTRRALPATPWRASASGPVSSSRGPAARSASSPASGAAASSGPGAPARRFASAARRASRRLAVSALRALAPGNGHPARATSAAASSSPRIARSDSAHALALMSTSVLSVVPSGSADVYDLTVNGTHEFFAGGILVHNCDEIGLWESWKTTWDESLKYAVRKGRSQIVATGTPKKSRKARELIRRLLADPAVRKSRLRTLDNRANLSESFFDEVVGSARGTRLEQQELEGVLLDDVEGALWTADGIDAYRVADVPDLIRVVVAVDPAVSNDEDSDETGIVVVGEAEGGHGFVLADYSMRGTPDACMRKAVWAYHHHSADRVIGEANNGGDYIGSLLATVDPNVPYEKVIASRGKRVRAEPVSALYEQGRVHHAGVHTMLEEQMVSWVPSDPGDSPDRVDALVWGCAALRGLSSGSWLQAYGVRKCADCARAYPEREGECPSCHPKTPGAPQSVIAQAGPEPQAIGGWASAYGDFVRCPACTRPYDKRRHQKCPSCTGGMLGFLREHGRAAGGGISSMTSGLGRR